MGSGPALRMGTRVLIAQPVEAHAQRAARRVGEAGGEATVVKSVAEAVAARGAFDRGIFAFDLPDGSGIVLAAEMTLANRVRDVDFFHPLEEASALEANVASARVPPEELARVA